LLVERAVLASYPDIRYWTFLEDRLPKLDVADSSPVSRSINLPESAR
jgi:hypothetical protein